MMRSCNINCPGISAVSASNTAKMMNRLETVMEGMTKLVDRAGVAERVDQGVGSSPFTRWLHNCTTCIKLLECPLPAQKIYYVGKLPTFLPGLAKKVGAQTAPRPLVV